MPKKAITQLFLDRIAPPKAGTVIYWDARQPGLGLRVSATGAKSWIAMYRVEGKLVKETLGTLAKVPNVSEARRLAEASREQAAKGVNPVAERKAKAERVAANTVGAAADRWLALCERDLKPKSVRGYRQIFSHDVLPRWGDRPLADIKKGDVLELLHDKATKRERGRKGLAHGATAQANRVLTRLRTFFGWCVANDLIAADPSAGVMKQAKETPRDRVLTDDEIRAFWAATEVIDAKRRDAPAFGALFRVLLLTAQREGEVAGMRRSEVDGATWTIPSSRTKNGKPHIVHLSGLALEVLDSVPAHDGEFVFSADGKLPVITFSHAKRRLDKAMVPALREAQPLVPWVVHDLRRTATTVMARLGIAPHVADKVLNHTAGTIHGVARIYNQFEYLEERKAALEALGRFVEGLVRPSAGNVVDLRQRPAMA